MDPNFEQFQPRGFFLFESLPVIQHRRRCWQVQQPAPGKWRLRRRQLRAARVPPIVGRSIEFIMARGSCRTQEMTTH